MSRGVLVSTGAAVCQREVDHRAKHQRRGKRILAGHRVGRRAQYLIVIAVQIRRPPNSERGCPVQGRAGHDTRNDNARSGFS